MRAVIQRVQKAAVTVDGAVTGAIGRGLVLLLGIARGDGEDALRYIAEKVLDLRIFPDEKHSMNLSLRDVGGEILLVSQFTLYGDARKGRRPGFDRAEAPPRAQELYGAFARYLAEQGFPPREGVFGADMQLELTNDGPVTILLESDRSF